MNKWRQQIEEIALVIIAALMRRISRRAAIRFGEWLGNCVYRIGIRTSVARNNLTAAFPETPPREIEETVRKCYRHFGALLAEFARLPLLKPENVPDLVAVENFNLLDEALKKGRGGVVVSGHLGNWELMGATFSVMGYPVNYVVTSQQNPRVEKLMDKLRESTGAKIIKRQEAVKGVLKALKKNELVAILADQDAHQAGVFVPFFRRLSSTPKGAATFALRAGSDLIFIESYRQDLNKLKIIAELISRDNLPDNREDAIIELTRRFTSRLEEAVRKHPEQWFWMHRRWKTSPENMP